MHYSESNIVMLNIMSLVFTRMPEKAPFFIKPLLRAIQAKAEQGILSLSPIFPNIPSSYLPLSTNPCTLYSPPLIPLGLLLFVPLGCLMMVTWG
jgi:hypothetical protein